MTRSAGTSGLMRVTSPPARATAARIAARSTTAGTPVKSWRTTRAGRNGTSTSPAAGVGPARERSHVGVANVTCPRCAAAFSSRTSHGERQAVEVGDALLLERRSSR